MEPQGLLDAESDVGVLVPSPQSETVTHEMEELSLQPSQNLPPLNERKNVLQLRLQQRRTREQLVDQGIMPPLKSPAAFHEQIRSLERARTENFLKHKIRSRPERSELVRMHILQETLAEPSLQATQLKLKRARLADDLNEKIAQRPGPMELVEKNILPVDSSVKEAIIVGQVNYPKTLDMYPFEEDSSDALSPEQPASQESQGSAPSPGEPRPVEASPPLLSSTMQYHPAVSQPKTELPKPVSTSDQPAARLAAAPQSITIPAPSKPGPTLVKHSQPKPAGDKSRSKKGKEPRPRVKKLKYHQYIPPDQKQEPSEAPMDSSYARLLQQQQLFLQLQILSQQQQQHYNYQAILPAPLKPVAEGQAGTSSVALNSNGGLTNSIVVSLPTAAPARPNNTLANRKPGPLPANLEDMKVAELKMELKLRGLPVSGTKTDLIERLRPFQESTSATTVPPPSFTGGTLSPSAMEVNASSTVQRLSPIQQGVPESMNSTPPASPMPLELCTVAAEEVSVAEPSKSAPVMSPRKEVPEEKDRRLHEKERQIEELMRRLEQEQRLVEELKMQLEVEKRGQQAGPALEQSPPAPVKEEKSISQNCLATWSPLTQPPVVKQEEPASNPAPGPIPPVSLPPFFIHPNVPQVLGQPQTLIPTQPGTTQILVPVSLPTTGTTIQLPSTTVSLQTQQIVQATVPTQAQDLIQPSVPKMISQKAENSGPQHLPNQNHHLTKTFPVCTTSASGLQYNPNQTRVMKEIPQCFLNSSPEGRSSTSLPNGPVNKTPSPPTFILQSSGFTGHAPKSKDPPRYEEAVKQTRSMQTQVPTATSQQMDDLFDILIESGEISPFIRQDLPPLTKTLPVTASITTLPINTVLSRPPPQVQVAPPPSLTLDSTPSLATLASDNQLEAFLEGTLSGEPEPRTLGLADELHCQLLDNPHSPMDTSELPFIDPTPPCSFDLHDTALDNMEWLDLTMPGPAGGLTALGMSTDLLDTHDLQLHWD
ncbi:myocardin-related transcription factor B isoform X1 [Scleropages formosus]|uniref:myocardin-related transcription factor B isoform X1 n=2 Tax=Scleropages formosus TaxID=113540 RepID=UPI000878BD00|nr:myocardin-related transcription factor B isoform X1 [Scleropages formosus]XP_018596089.1 myocardin-related transcription factor B isoform X1 [Scleropages formosus]